MYKMVDCSGKIKWGVGEKRETREGTQGRIAETKTFKRLYGYILILS